MITSDVDHYKWTMFKIQRNRNPATAILAMGAGRNVALRRFSQPMKTADAEQYLSTVFRPLLAVHSSQSLYVEALHLHAQSGLSWYDSSIVSAALQARCDLLFTEDL